MSEEVVHQTKDAVECYPVSSDGSSGMREEVTGQTEEDVDVRGWFPAGLTWEWIATAQNFTIKRIPKGVRLLWADLLVKTLRGLLGSPHDDRRWRLLFALPKLCLRLPKRGGKKKRQAFESGPFIAEKLKRALTGDWQRLWEEAEEAGRVRRKRAESDGSASAVRERVTALVEEGQFTKAVQALNSDGIHKLDPNIIKQLREKHPVRKELSEPREGEVGEAAQFDVEDVIKAIASFGRTAPGASRFRASYLQDALSVPAGDTEGRLSGALTGLVNLLARGAAPEGSAAWIAGAPLYPLRKKDGGVRPVAVGEVLRRLVSKCFCSKFKGRCEKTFLEVGQVGVGIKGGAEAAVTAVRNALERGDKNLGVLKVDLENAFNSIDRKAVLEAVREFFPEVEAWFRFCYGAPAKLFCEGTVLPFGSAQGVQQGDPLGPLLFSLGLLGVCRTLKQGLAQGSLAVWYLDDGTVVGEAKELTKAWKLICSEVGKAGLKVNQGKCELFGSRFDPAELLQGLEEVPLVHDSGFDLLGAPIGDKTFCESYVRKRIQKIEGALKKLDLIDDPQVERLLLRSCLGLPRFLFALRSAPPEDIAESIKEFDQLVTSVLNERLGVALTKDEEIQARMPEGLGGLGVESAGVIAESAYLGNVLATRHLVGRLLGEETLDLQSVRGVREAFESWKSKTGVALEHVEDMSRLKEMETREGALHPQRVLSGFVYRKMGEDLLAKAPNPREELRLRAVMREGAGAWWSVIPVRQLGLKFDRDEFLALVKWWLGLPVYAGQQGMALICPEAHCEEVMDAKGDHAVMCPYGPSRTARHDGVNKVWAATLKSAGMSVKVEQMIEPDSKRRSADTLVDGWEFGRSAAHDWTVGHVLQKAALTQKNPDFVVDQAESHKDSYAKERCRVRGLDFLPLAMDSFGGMGVAARKAVNVAVAHARIFHGNALYDRSLTRRMLAQRLQVAVMRGVARQLLRRLGVDDERGGF